MCTSEGCVSLLSLIPHLIMQEVPGWEPVVGVAGWNTSTAEVPGIAGAATSVVVAGGELAHCWVLRRHPVRCCSLVRLLAGHLTHSLSSGGCGGVGGFGVWLCVECCIVDASILLWSSV